VQNNTKNVPFCKKCSVLQQNFGVAVLEGIARKLSKLNSQAACGDGDHAFGRLPMKGWRSGYVRSFLRKVTAMGSSRQKAKEFSVFSTDNANQYRRYRLRLRGKVLILAASVCGFLFAQPPGRKDRQDTNRAWLAKDNGHRH